MDLSEETAYYGEIFSYCKVPEGGDYRGTLETNFLCIISESSGVDPDEHLFLESSNIKTSNEEVRAYRNRLENHSVGAVLGNRGTRIWRTT